MSGRFATKSSLPFASFFLGVDTGGHEVAYTGRRIKKFSLLGVVILSAQSSS